MNTNSWQVVWQRIEEACARVGREKDKVRLLAVSKTFSPEDILALNAMGQRSFGENYIQEAVEKIVSLRDHALEWHCIGPVQSNKTRVVAEYFDWVQSIDRLKIAERLSAQRAADAADLQVCIQVNIDGSASKSGVTPLEALQLGQAIMQLPRLKLRGIMVIPDPAATPAECLQTMLTAKKLYDSLCFNGLPLDTLSMGMSGDLEEALAAGSTMLRIGTALFGKR